MTNSFRLSLVWVSFFVPFGLMGQDPPGSIRRSAFQTLNSQTQAGPFDKAGRNIARAPALTNLDFVADAQFPHRKVNSSAVPRGIFRCLNHANFGLPIGDVNSPNFEKIFTAAPARLMQFALKLIF
jgi:hypothetical protein